MFTKEQKTRISEIQEETSTKIRKFLSHFPITQHKGIDNPVFETEVFLFALTQIAFPAQGKELTEIERKPLLLYADEADLMIRHRLSLYEKVSEGIVNPCGFWSAAPIDSLLSVPILRICALFGDFLVSPYCSWRYEDHEWPNLSGRASDAFSHVFMARLPVWANYYIGEVAGVIACGADADEEQK